VILRRRSNYQGPRRPTSLAKRTDVRYHRRLIDRPATLGLRAGHRAALVKLRGLDQHRRKLGNARPGRPRARKCSIQVHQTWGETPLERHRRIPANLPWGSVRLRRRQLVHIDHPERGPLRGHLDASMHSRKHPEEARLAFRRVPRDGSPRQNLCLSHSHPPAPLAFW